MGLAIDVGLLARSEGSNDEKKTQLINDLNHINEVLTQAGLPAHSEPTSFDEFPPSRASLASFPYSWLHNLRRFASHVMRDPKWVPSPLEPGEDPATDPVLHQLYRELSSHLLCHSDSEGYYLPIDFEKPFLDPAHNIRGGTLGSSVRLREELLLLVDPLEIEVDNAGDLSDEVAARVAAQRPTGAPFAIERLVWLTLYEAARISIEKKTAIVFI